MQAKDARPLRKQFESYVKKGGYIDICPSESEHNTAVAVIFLAYHMGRFYRTV